MIDIKNLDKKIAEILKPYRIKILQVVGVFLCFCIISLTFTFYGDEREKILGVDGTSDSSGTVFSDGTVSSDGSILSDGSIPSRYSDSTVPIGNYRTWTQSDPRWADKILGASGDNMRDIGCAVTAAAMIAVHSGSITEENFNPGILCDFLSANGGFNSYGDIYWAAINKIVPPLTYEGAVVLEGTKAQKISTIKTYINCGYYLAVAVRNYGHFVAVDYVTDTNVYIIDPASVARKNLFEYYEESGVVALRLFKSKATSPDKPQPEPDPVFSDGYYFVTAATGLNHRTGPGTSYASNGVVPFGSLVYVTQTQSSWGKYVWNGKEGWSSFEYLEQCLMGDIDNNGVVNITDIIYLLQYLGNKRTFTNRQFAIADCYYDNRLNAQDLAVLVNITLKQV